MDIAQRGAHGLAQRRQVRGIRRVVGEAGEVHPREPGQMLQHVPRADLVAAIGRERDAMGEEQDVVHQPSPRAIGGPSRLATQSGRRCHSAICIRYFGLSGLTSRRSPQWA